MKILNLFLNLLTKSAQAVIFYFVKDILIDRFIPWLIDQLTS